MAEPEINLRQTGSEAHSLNLYLMLHLSSNQWGSWEVHTQPHAPVWPHRWFMCQHSSWLVEGPFWLVGTRAILIVKNFDSTMALIHFLHSPYKKERKFLLHGIQSKHLEILPKWLISMKLFYLVLLITPSGLLCGFISSLFLCLDIHTYYIYLSIYLSIYIYIDIYIYMSTYLSIYWERECVIYWCSPRVQAQSTFLLKEYIQIHSLG